MYDVLFTIFTILGLLYSALFAFERWLDREWHRGLNDEDE